LGCFTIEKTYEEQTLSIESVELQIIQSGNTKAKIGTRKDDHRGFELLLEVGRDAGPVSFTFTLQLSNSNAVEAHRAAAFALALSKRGTLKLIQNATGFEYSAETGALPELEIDSKFVELLRRLAIIQVKTKTVLTLTREFSNDDLPAIQKAFLAVTEGKLTTEPFTFTLQPTEEYDESALTALRGQIVFKTDNDEIGWILDTPINLGPIEVVADNGLLRIERTDPPSEGAPYGVKHVRLESVEDSLIYVNYPRFSGVECIGSKQPQSPMG
jgi:hypothetical protein